jgi:hypothetical protein
VTFAALQESTRNVFNPTKLVESLRLRTSEQQDAQEFVPCYMLMQNILPTALARFSKLFMSHLDLEFQKQSIPSLRSLIANQATTTSNRHGSFINLFPVPGQTGIWNDMQHLWLSVGASEQFFRD